MPSAGRLSRVFCTNQPLPHAYVFVRHENVRFAVAISVQVCDLLPFPYGVGCYSQP
jgi:hypothetical protein